MRDASGVRAEFEEECRRVGVRLEDALHLLDLLPPRAPGLHALGFDLTVGLAYLQAMPDNAGTLAFVECIRPHFTALANQHVFADVARADDSPAGPKIELAGPPFMVYGTMREIEYCEDYLLTVVTSLTGDAASRDRVLERRGVYTQYSKVFDAYLELAGDGIEGVEALRRGTFLYWCSATQPACLTGIGELSESQEEEVISWLEDACTEGTLDSQLRWMLGYYHGAYSDVFGRFTQARALQRLLARTFPESWRSAEPEARHFAGRGLMGRFWTQLVLAD